MPATRASELSAARYIAEFTRYVDRMIARFAPWIEKELNAEGRRAAEAYARAGELAALNAVKEPLYYGFVERMWVTVVPDAGARVEEQLAKGVADLFLTSALEWLAANGASKATEMWIVSRTELQRAIFAGVRAGETRQQITARIVRARGTVAPDRALRIATTEIHAAANHGSIAAARDQGVRMTKTWRAMPGARPTHAAASGQEVGLDEQFRVGNALLDYPGAVGPAAETINCRCIVLYAEVGTQPRWRRPRAA